MGLKEVNGFKRARTKRKIKPWAMYDMESENGPR